MPVFDFKCESCSFVVEKIVPREEKQIVCEKCNGVMKRQVAFFQISSEAEKERQDLQQKYKEHINDVRKTNEKHKRELKNGRTG